MIERGFIYEMLTILIHLKSQCKCPDSNIRLVKYWVSILWYLISLVCNNYLINILIFTSFLSKWLILWFTILLLNTHMRRQYPNWDSIIVFKRIHLCLKLIEFDSLASLLPSFLHNEVTCSLKFRFLSISKPESFC